MGPSATLQQSQTHLSHLERLSTTYCLVAIYAFGSRASEISALMKGFPVQSKYPNSDLDIGVLPAIHHHLSVDDIICLTLALEEIFQVPHVDLVVLTQAPVFLALDSVRCELLYTSDADAEARYQLYILARAGDLAEWELENRQIVLNREA